MFQVSHIEKKKHMYRATSGNMHVVCEGVLTRGGCVRAYMDTCVFLWLCTLVENVSYMQHNMCSTTCAAQHVQHNMCNTTCAAQHVQHNMCSTTYGQDGFVGVQLRCRAFSTPVQF
jgi:hypothetical protein